MGSTLIDAVNAAYLPMANFYASDWAAQEIAREGTYVAGGCAVTASGTAGKIDVSAGTIVIAGTRYTVSAVTAYTTSIATLVSNNSVTSGKAMWVLVEVDTSAAVQFTAGTPTLVASVDPVKPPLTVSRVAIAWLYVYYDPSVGSPTVVDALNTNANGAAKIIDGRNFSLSTIPPTVQKYTTGSGTYTTPAGVKYIRVRMVGGGGGGGGSASVAGANGGVGGTGGNTTFGTSLLVANGGAGGDAATNGGQKGGNGGTASLGSGPIGTALSGGGGNSGGYAGTAGYMPGGGGAGTPFGGGGSGGSANGNGFPTVPANTGGGGGGGGSPIAGLPGNGGGAGGFVDATISALLSTYAYGVGAAGSAGAAGTSGFVGVAGSAGYIEVTEFY